MAVSRQNDLYHNGDRPTTLFDQATESRAREMTDGSPHLVKTLVQMDAPEHPKFRALTQGWFMPANIRKLEAHIREIAREAIDGMAAMGGECDFVQDVALRFPLHVIMQILGVPREDEPRMLRLTQELFGAQDPDTVRIVAQASAAAYAEATQAVLQDFYAYFAKISEARIEAPQDDLATVIANARIAGEPINGLEQLSYYVIVATAGHDTTSSSLAGGLAQLAANKDEFAKVKGGQSLIPSLVEESICWSTPVKHFMRSATADTDLGGQRIARGDWLMLCYASGNRDETVFDEPWRFKADRSPNRHLAFGYGAHLCLGQHLAKMELRIFWEELLPRLSWLELGGEPSMVAASFVNGLKTLPIRFELG